MDIDEDKWKKRFRDGWNLPGDAASDAREDTIAFPQGDEAAKAKDEGPVSFMTIFHKSPGFGDDRGVSWKAILAGGVSSYQHKWRHGILLARDQNDLLIRYKDPRVAWSSVKEARRRGGRLRAGCWKRGR